MWYNQNDKMRWGGILKRKIKKILFLFLLGLGLFSQVQGINAETQKKVSDPFTVLMLGVDTGEYGREDVGRSDIIVVASVNPNTETTLMTSIPRDSYTEIVGEGFMDKINHAYAFGGTNMSADTVANFLNIPIDHTIAVDMGGFIELVDSVGGITVVPDTNFELNGYYFEAGVPTEVDGEGALAYVRERYTSGGDSARQVRAQEVIREIIKEGLSPANASKMPEFLKVAQEYIKLDVGLSDLATLKDSFTSMSNTAEAVPLESYGETIDGIYYEIVEPNSLENASQAHRENLGLE